MIRRRQFIAGFGGTAAWPLVARAQQRHQIKRIAYIAGGSAGINLILTPIRRELANLGWVEGHNVHVEALIELDRGVVRAAAPFVEAAPPTSSS